MQTREVPNLNVYITYICIIVYSRRKTGCYDGVEKAWRIVYRYRDISRYARAEYRRRPERINCHRAGTRPGTQPVVPSFALRNNAHGGGTFLLSRTMPGVVWPYLNALKRSAARWLAVPVSFRHNFSVRGVGGVCPYRDADRNSRLASRSVSSTDRTPHIWIRHLLLLLLLFFGGRLKFFGTAATARRKTIHFGSCFRSNVVHFLQHKTGK